MGKKLPKDKLVAKQTAMLKALAENYGEVAASSRIVGISRETHYKWLTVSDIYKKEVENIQESLLDRAETILHERLGESDTALIFFLKTKGKHRGYIEKQEIDLTKVEVIDPFKNAD